MSDFPTQVLGTVVLFVLSGSVAVNAAPQEITASGAYEEIYDRWFGADSDAPLPLQGTIEVLPNG